MAHPKDFDKKIADTKRDLDAISPSFCLAKWLQVTVHLHSGFNHSCHHPDLHKIPLDELQKDPSALHNTLQKKEMRRQMKSGERPAECEFCWNVEDAPGKHFSDRVIKSADDWALPRLQEIAALPYDKNVNPSYVEVSFGTDCNFRCSYCVPHVSNGVWASYEKHGPFEGQPTLEWLTSIGRKPYGPEDANPYVDAFWNWFPRLAPDLRTFRITGGEPLINPNTFKVLDYIDEHPLPHLQLCVNSNLGVPDAYYDRFLAKVGKLTEEKKIGSFMLFTSIDTHGEQAEYLRKGLSYERWLKNVRRYLAQLPWDVSYMVTFNALSPPRFIDLLKDLMAVNREFGTVIDGEPDKRAWLDVTHLRHPEPLSVHALTEEWRTKMQEIETFMKEHGKKKVGGWGFTDHEIHKVRRINSWVKLRGSRSTEARNLRARFFTFTQQYEQRENVAFLDVFPEMRAFLAQCREERWQVDEETAEHERFKAGV